MPSLRRMKSVQDLYIMLDNLMPMKRCQLCYYDVENFFAASIWESSRNYTPPLFSCKPLPSLRNTPTRPDQLPSSSSPLKDFS